MPSLLQQKKAYNKKYYQESKPRVENQESAPRSRYDKKYYVQNAENAENVKSKARVKYETDPKKKKALARAQYQCHPETLPPSEIKACKAAMKKNGKVIISLVPRRWSGIGTRLGNNGIDRRGGRKKNNYVKFQNLLLCKKITLIISSTN